MLFSVVVSVVVAVVEISVTEGKDCVDGTVKASGMTVWGTAVVGIVVVGSVVEGSSTTPVVIGVF
jgi:hypothetical protein